MGLIFWEANMIFSIIRRFDQSLIEGEARFQDELSNISEMIKTYFNIEGLTERLRTCRREEKKELWNEMKALGKRNSCILALIISICTAYGQCVF